MLLETVVILLSLLILPDDREDLTMPDGFNSDNTYEENGYSYVITDGGVTTTVYFDSTFEIIGEAIEDPATGVSFSEYHL